MYNKLVEQMKLDSWDVAFFIITLAISILIGVYFATKNKNLEEYLLGGRNQKLIPVSMSMMTSFVSGLTLVGNPVEYYLHGITYTPIVCFGFLISVPISVFIFLPVFHRLDGISIFSYLELRYGTWCKRLVSIIFMLQMTLYSAVVLYVPSLSLKSILGISETVSIGLVGIVCLIYCTIGGIKAVIWTDFFQAGLMYTSILCICAFGTYEAGGFARILEVNRESGRLSFDAYFVFDLKIRHTIYTTIFGAHILYLYLNGANQIQVQRCLSLPSLRQAQWSQLISASLSALMALICLFAGLVIYATYKDCDPYLSKQIDKRDATVIFYVATHLEYLVGLRGVFVAGIFAATLSTLSSFANSMAALVLEDFIKPAFADRGTLSEKLQTWLGKLIALLFGLACIGATFFVSHITGLLQVASTLLSVSGAPIIAAFLLGMLTRVVNTFGILVGMLSGFTFGMYIQLYQAFYLPPIEPSMPISISNCYLTGQYKMENSTILPQIVDRSAIFSQDVFLGLTRISYFWIPTFSFIITCAISLVISILTGGPKEDVDERCLVSWLQHDIRLNQNDGKFTRKLTKKGRESKI